MIENKAYALAVTLDADMLLMPNRGGYAVGVTRADGSYVVFRDTHGAIYADEDACLSSPHGERSFAEWGGWGSGESWAVGLATLIGGQAHRSSDVWTVLLQRVDGRFAVIGADQVEVYQSRGHYENCEKPEYLGWDW